MSNTKHVFNIIACKALQKDQGALSRSKILSGSLHTAVSTDGSQLFDMAVPQLVRLNAKDTIIITEGTPPIQGPAVEAAIWKCDAEVNQAFTTV